MVGNKIKFNTRIHLFLILCTVGLFPITSFAYDTNSILSTAEQFGYDTSTVKSYLDAGQKAGIDLSSTGKIKDYLNSNVRNTTKLAAQTARSGLNFLPDSEWKREQMALVDKTERDALDKINRTVGQIGKAESMYGLMNVAGKIPQVMGLLDEIKNLGTGGANPAEMVGTLEKIGSIAGFEIPADFKQGFGMIANMGSGIEGAAGALQSVLGNGGGGGIFGGSGQNMLSAAQIPGANKEAGGVMSQVLGAGGVGAQAGSTISKANQTMQNNQNTLQQNQQQGQNICNNMQNSESDSGSDGVPVIEQPGALLGYNKQIAKVTTQMRGISQKICEDVEEILKIQKDLQKKEREDDVTASKKAREAIKNEKKEFEKRMREERKPSNKEEGEAKESFYPTISKYLKEELEAIRVKGLQNIKESNIPEKIKTPLLKTFEQEVALLKEPDSAYKAVVEPTPGFDPESLKSKKGSELTEGIITLTLPQNNLYGQYLLNRAELQKLEEKRMAEAEREWQTFQIMPETKCIKWAEYEGERTCIEREIVTPAKWVADQGSAFATTKLRMTENSDESEEDDKSALGQGSSVSGTTAETSGQSQGETPSGNSSGDLDIIGTLQDLYNQFSGGDEARGDQEEFVEEGPVQEEAPLPEITLTKGGTTADPLSGRRSTRISWTAKNASYCTAGNDWVSYGDENIATTTSKIVFHKDDLLPGDNDDPTGREGNLAITHPSLFRYSVYASGENRPTGTIPQTVSHTLSIATGSLTETIKYSPNINGLLPNDTIFLSLNGQTVSIQAGTEDEDPSKEDIAKRLFEALENEKDPNKKKEFGKYIKTITGNVLNLTRKIDSFTRTNKYIVTCYGEDDRDVSKPIDINFQ